MGTMVVLLQKVLPVFLVLALGYVMLVHGWTAAIKLGARGFYDSIPWLSRFWMYLPVPVAGAGMIVFSIEQLYQHIKVFFVKEEKTEEKEVAA